VDMKALARKHLERRLAPLREVDLTRPQGGWLRAMREAMGMKTRQLAQRRVRSASTHQKISSMLGAALRDRSSMTISRSRAAKSV